ncbi:3-hydroxybutyryl-CoA dehydrogenase [Chromobacterium alkanivorans]|uniref:3-hydroxybutyryl-CoA dehydrogenase n=1 Tax=Chromobacterium alkanivorans TaxID=1071719 RepID=UPI002166D88F|nr:3-hydroxybutyryl-CoA dehydrogenase [Chromobacterium alkanivorans]MCS3805851.1 3-hydroxybutyryl-CoA dehydrogenase [Chromobacterium alkanivorans]MCS3820189.1 3-hydroxybutyryl-CoA dehydrogenase [Chromobacterium alkanivorans]MCS3874947.1 3-hydroxybutyryl-CoA dehydrogenase [Chromobacterium alkanivorans]
MQAKIAVVGAGTMGNGIAQVFAAHGYDVRLADVNQAALDKGLAAIASSLARLVKKELLAEADVPAILARVQTTTRLADLADRDLVVEAATENAAVKESIFRELAAVVRPDAVLASNTSSISLTRIASWVSQPERVVGMHFMNPVPVMQLVEIIRALQTSDAAYRLVYELSQALGKTPVTVKDAAGFVSNRVLMPMINEAAFTLHENLASAEDIDTVMKLGMNHPIGPLALADLIGLDTCLSIMDILYTEFRDSKYRACPLLAQLVQAGHLGRKSGKGFYSYA